MQDVGGGLSPARQASTTRTDLTMQPVQFKLISNLVWIKTHRVLRRVEVPEAQR